MEEIRKMERQLADMRYELKRRQRRIKMLETQYQDYKRYMWGMLSIQTIMFSIIIFGLAMYVFSR